MIIMKNQVKRCLVLLALLSPVCACAAEPNEVKGYQDYRNKMIADHTRPIYHLISPEGGAHVADPNFAFFWKGKYHLFFIARSGYAHVSSVDLVHWRWHPNFHGPLCSGGIFVNKDGRPTIITTSAWENGKLVLYSALDDDLETWAEPVPIEPQVRPDQEVSKMVCWDPEIWTEGNTSYALQGVFPLGVGKEATLMKSTDQKNWEYVGPFMSREMPDVQRNTEVARKNEDVSCPNFFKIGDPADKSWAGKWMLLCISHIRGCRYYLGDWKNEQFVPGFHARMNWSLSEGMKDGDPGGEFFAPESLLAPDGRRVMWAWLFAMSQKRISGTWHEAMSLPREISLPRDGILRIKPLKELEQLRYNPICEKDIVVESGATNRLKNVAGDTIEIMATIKQGDASRYGVRLLCDNENGNGLDLVVEPGAKSIKLGSTTAPFELKRGEDIQLRIFVDRSIVEVFVNDRQAVVKQHAYAPGDVGVCLFSEGGKMKVRELKAWTMAASNPW
jgi:sucrose-6-phosphate hydrolase SacC (GH32 family)